MFSKTKTSLAAAGIATLGAATSAQAAIVTVDVMAPFAFGATYDLDGDGVDDIRFIGGSSMQVGAEFTAQSKGSPPTGLSPVLGAGAGVPTGAGSLSGSAKLLDTDGSASDIPAGPLAPLPNSGFIGIRFPGSGTLLEGWLQFAATGATLGELEVTFVSYGYEDGGGAITMGAGVADVPLPAAGLLLVGGMAALGAAGRRRRARF